MTKESFNQNLAHINQKLADIENHRKLSDDLRWLHGSLINAIAALQVISTDKNGNLMNTFDGQTAQDMIQHIARNKDETV